MKKSLLNLLLLAVFIISLSASANIDEARKNYEGKKPKYVFYFVGDGMGMPQINAAQAYLSAKNGNKLPAKLAITTLPSASITATYAANRYITGSAAAGTALACGEKTSINTIGMNADHSKKLQSVAEVAKERGKKVGIISSVSIDHATPACFYAHQKSRSMYYEIDHDLANSNFDFFGGGGLKDPEGKRSKSEKKVNALELAKENGFKYVNSKADFKKLSKNDGKVIAVAPNLAGGKSLKYAIDQNSEDITLAEFTSKAIELLDNDKKGFFIMVEGGKIDWACHANDAVGAIEDLLALDKSVKVALDFYNKHKDETIIVVAGDHETGGMTIGYSGLKYETAFTKLLNQKMSQEALAEKVSEWRETWGTEYRFAEMLSFLETNFGLGKKELELSDQEKNELLEAAKLTFTKDFNPYRVSEEQYLLYGGYEPFSVTTTHLLNQKAGIAWTTYSHTAVPIPCYALGVGDELFKGFYFENTDVANNLKTILTK